MTRYLAIFLLVAARAPAAPIAGFQTSPYWNEQVREQKLANGVRTVTNAPAADQFDPKRPTLLIIYALPNGNTIEQTIGCTEKPGLDWHFYIQHIGAQTRRLREVMSQRNIVITYVEAKEKSWPAWRKAHGDNPAQLRKIVNDLAGGFADATIALAAHSGGGSFITGYLNSAGTIDPKIERIAYLDANYSYDDKDEHHGDKLIAWLRGDKSHHLVVIAYDDRNITFQGKPVVSATGGTYRATHRMLDRFAKEDNGFLTTSDDNSPIEKYSTCGNRALFMIHRNPENKILHTVLVGDMSGFLKAMTFGTEAENKWGEFGTIGYQKWIQPAPAATQPATTRVATREAGATLDLRFNFAPRAADAPAGSEVMKKVDAMTREDREKEILEQIKRGNVPQFLRRGVIVHADANGHHAAYVAAPDYLAIGSDKDFVRVPLTPKTAQVICDLLNCSLPTRKMSNDVYAQASIKLEPRPLTEKREAAATFVQHNAIIESQRGSALLGDPVAGIKKDVVITNRLLEKPDHVAIFGWHKLNGEPIQPLTTVHIGWYVDYSHGIRLVKREMLVDDKPANLDEVLRDPKLCDLVSDEGALKITKYQ